MWHDNVLVNSKRLERAKGIGEMIKSFLENRKVIIGSSVEELDTKWCPQGSSLGPILKGVIER